MNELIGRQLDNYRIEALLGEGGMGTVYRARDVNLNRAVALKVMSRHLAQQPEFQQRFRQEAQAAARLNHPSIAKIHRFGTWQGVHFIDMEYVPGLTLGAYLRRLPQQNQIIKLGETLVIVAQIGDALGYAHRQGVVHRDVKPDNVLLSSLPETDGANESAIRVVVTDFGLAKLLEGGFQTQPDMFIGTIPYMSPEQCLGRTLDGRSDIYSLGIVLYQLATGRLPFDVKTPVDAAEKHIRAIPPAPRTIRPGLPAAVEEIITKAIAKKPAERYQTGEALARALRQAAAGLTVADQTQIAPPESIVSLATKLRSRAEFDGDDIDLDIVPAIDADLLIIQQPGETSRSHRLEQATLTIGRSRSNAITLDAADISRQHTRLERTTTGWRVVDLGSDNGTYLEGSKLLPDVPVTWQPGQMLRIGPYFLRWQRATSIGPIGVGPTSVPPVPSGATQMLSHSGQLVVNVIPAHIDVRPGGQVDIQVELFNQGVTVDHFQLDVEELPGNWVTISQDPVHLMPGHNVSLPVRIHPPRNSSAAAGRHPYRLVVRPAANPQETTVVSGSVNVAPFEQFAIHLRPVRLPNGGASRLSIHNEGNVATTFRIIGRDESESIEFKGQRDRVSILPGQTETVKMAIAARQRPLLGSAEMRPFQIHVEAPSGQNQVQTGQLEVKPLLPSWIVPILAALLLLLCLVGGATFAFIDRQNDAATATAIAADDDGDGLTNVQEAGLGTDLNNMDTDGDGVFDKAEVDAETNPLNPDSDNDGLSDGEERNWGTKPLVGDSDGDTLSDGREVHELKTSPTNVDTDGDGLNDNVDPDPGSLPTPTPLPTDTPVPTVTPTDAPTEAPTEVPTDTPTPTPTPEPLTLDLVADADRYWLPQGPPVLCDPSLGPCTGPTPDPEWAHGDSLYLQSNCPPPSPLNPSICLGGEGLIVLYSSLNGIPPGVVIQQATLLLTLESGQETGRTVSVGRATSSWTEDSASGPSCDFESAVDSDIPPVAGQYSWDVTEMIRFQYANPAQKHGVCLQLNGEGERVFTSREGNVTRRPSLRIVYQP